MGFLSGLMGGSKTNIPASGFYAMPGEYQSLYNSLLGQANTLYGDNATAAAAFTPMPLTDGETAAMDKMYAGFAPTEQSLRKDIGMFMNPYDDYVINSINREATGMNSLVNQQASQAGQQGSNRSFLGTSDVEQNRLNNIGTFRQSQYNNSINNVLNSLIPQRQQDAYNSLQAGTYERDIDNATRLAPYTALNAGQGSLQGFPTSFGDFGSQAQTVKTGGGIGGLLGAAGGLASMATGNPMFSILGGAASGYSNGGGLSGMISGASRGGFSNFGSLGQNVGSFFSSSPMGPYLPYGVSDERLKENIEYIGVENGIPMYEFNYDSDHPYVRHLNLPTDIRYIGTMAQDILKIEPDAVFEFDGFMRVNYDMIGVEMRQV